MLEGGADPSLADGDGDSPLMLAVERDHLEVLQLLLEHGAALDAVDLGLGCTAFHRACDCNHPNCVEVLVRAGCDVGIKDKDGKTGAEMAEGNTAVVELLAALEAEQLAGGRFKKKKRKKRPKKKTPAASVSEPEPRELELDEFAPLEQLLCLAAAKGDAAAVALARGGTVILTQQS